MKIATHYDNLKVARNASPEVIRAAYKGLTQRYHPDRNPNERERCERIMKIINQAFEVLSNPQRRTEHDAWIAEQEAAARVENVVGTGTQVKAGADKDSAPPQPTQADTAPVNSTASYAAAADTFRASRMNRDAPAQGADGGYTGPLYNQYEPPRAPASADRIAAAREAYRAERAERLRRKAMQETATAQGRDDDHALHDPTATPTAAMPLLLAGQVFSTGDEHFGVGDGGDKQNAAKPSDTSTNAPKPAGLLYALIVLLKFGGVLTGFALYGQLTGIDASILPEFANAWGNMKLQLWLVWGIATAAYFAAGHLLASRNSRSTRWKAASWIWAGAITAPLVGLLLAPMGLPDALATTMPAYYVPKAIRGVLFATACMLYLIFSRRVKRTYPATVPRAIRAEADMQAAREYTIESGQSAIAVLALWGVSHQASRGSYFPAWMITFADFGVWLAGILCVGFAVAALAVKWRTR